jgi:hypothetical protein
MLLVGASIEFSDGLSDNLQNRYYSVSKLLSLLTFLFIFNYLSYLNFLKIIIYFAIIYFINKKNLITTYNFTYLNKYFE